MSVDGDQKCPMIFMIFTYVNEQNALFLKMVSIGIKNLRMDLKFSVKSRMGCNILEITLCNWFFGIFVHTSQFSFAFSDFKLGAS